MVTYVTLGLRSARADPPDEDEGAGGGGRGEGKRTPGNAFLARTRRDATQI